MILRTILTVCFFLLLSFVPASAEIYFQDLMECSPFDPGCTFQIEQDWHNSHANTTVCDNAFEIDTDPGDYYQGSGAYHFTNGRYCRDAEQCAAIGIGSYPCDWASDAEFVLINKSVRDGGSILDQHFDYNKVYWIGFAVKLGNNIEAADRVTIDIGSEWGLIWQIHHSREACDVDNGFNNPPLALFINGGSYTGLRLHLAGEPLACKSSGSPEYSRNYTYASNGGSGADASQLNISRGSWHAIVINFRPAYDPAENPFFRLWIDGVLTINDTDPNCFNDAVGLYQMLGVYSHANEAWDAWYDSFKIGGPNSSYSEVAPGGAPTNQPPTISITVDGGTSTVTDTAGNSHNFQATTGDADGSVSSVYWHLDGCYADQTVEDPGNLTLSTVASCDVYATATDNESAATDSNHITVTIGSPSISGLVNEMEFGDDTNVATDSQGNTNFDINENSVVGAELGTDPSDGTYSAALNGTNQAIGWTEEAYNSNAPWQTGQVDGSLVVYFTTPDAYPESNMWLWSMYDQTNDERVIGTNLSAYTLSPNILTGVSSGASGELFESGYQLSLSTTYKLGIYVNSSTGEVRGILATGGTVLSTWSGTVSGTMNITNRPDFLIGRRSDNTSDKYFGGTDADVSYFALYNTELSNADFQSIFGIPQGTGDSAASWSGGPPSFELETGANDLVVTADTGSGTDQWHFQGTVSAASSHTSVSATQIKSAAISANGGSFSGTGSIQSVTSPQSGQTLSDSDTVDVYVTFTGTDPVDVTLPTPGAADSLSVLSPFYIDTDGTVIATQQVVDCTTLEAITERKTYYLGDEICIEWTFSDNQVVTAGGPYSNIALPFTLDQLQLNFYYYQGGGTSTWILRGLVTSGMVEGGNLVLSDVGDLDLDYATPGSPSTIEDQGGNLLTSTDTPQVEADPNHEIRIDGSPQVRSGRSGGGSVTISW